MRAVVTVIGNDKIGIIAEVSRVLSDSMINILDITQTTMQDVFTMIMLVDLTHLTNDFSSLSEQLTKKGVEMGLMINIQREDIFNSMHRL